MSIKGSRWCSAPNCRAKLHTNLSFFSFPLDSERCKTWILNCERLDLLEKTPEYCHMNCKLCASHFEDKMFLNNLRNRLQPHAVPTRFHSFPPQTETDGNSTQIVQESSLSSMPGTSREMSVQTSGWLSINAFKRKLQDRAKMERSKMLKLDESINPSPNVDKNAPVTEFMKMCDTFLPPTLAKIFKCKVGLRVRKKMDSMEYKRFALTIYFLCPQTYKFFRRTFCLPFISTLKRMIDNWHFGPGVNEFIFKALKLKVDMLSEESKTCLLCLNEISLKSNLFYDISKDEVVGFHYLDEKKKKIAKFAVVGMLRSIHEKWELPIVYGFTESTCSNNELQNFVYSTIEKLTGIGLDIKAVVSDIRSNFYDFARTLKITPEKPFFEVGNKKIFYCFDTPHLLKALRNIFFKYNLVHNNGVIDKNYVNMFYDTVRKRNLLSVLTYPHVYPNPFQKTKTKLAAQIFSASVASGMALQMEFNFLPPAAEKTMHFIDKIDKLFDLMNSSYKKSAKKYNRAFTGRQYQIDFVNEMQDMFKDLKIVERNTGKDVTTTIKCFKCWQISLASLKELWGVLECDVLYTRRLNQDCLENFIHQVRKQRGRCVNPTPIQFQREFKKLFSLKYLKHEGKAISTTEFMTYIDSAPHNSVLPEAYATYIRANIGTADYRKLELPKENPLKFICGYLLKKCLRKHQCDVCTTYADSCSDLSDATHLTNIRLDEQPEMDDFKALIVLPNHFFDYVTKLEDTFIENFENYAMKHPANLLLRELENIQYTHPCDQFPVDFLIKLFIRMRIFYCLKFLNRKSIRTNIRIGNVLSLAHL